MRKWAPRLAAIVLAVSLGATVAIARPPTGQAPAAYPDRVSYAGQSLGWGEITEFQDEGRALHILVIGDDQHGLTAYAFDSVEAKNSMRAQLMSTPEPPR